ncbi:MAG: AraC family transcriptional regulator [Mangrovibacterium sp.]
MANNLQRFGFSDIKETSPYMIKNFILSNNIDNPLDINFEYPFCFDGIVFITCLKGTGKVKINFKEYLTEENSILTILPNQIVEIIENSDDLFIETLAFSFDFLSDIPIPKDFNMPGRVAKKPMLKLPGKDIQNLLRYHSFIIDTFNNKKSSLFEQIIKGQLYSLLMEIAALYIEREAEAKIERNSTRREDITEQFLELLKDHCKSERSASYYADKMFITPKYLSATLKKVTGRSINSWIEDAVIMEAKILLRSTNFTVLQISEDLNFPNSSYFGRFFKKNTGMTPQKYRES